jgi:hypothetical protein
MQGRLKAIKSPQSFNLQTRVRVIAVAILVFIDYLSILYYNIGRRSAEMYNPRDLGAACARTFLFLRKPFYKLIINLS